MALDRFKTQVLLLHSEQSTLDSLSSGFSDRYTVHCATSGSEALNTLVETPINVIITAQELPGMSGLEALREARKRSPDTIGILLAGNSDRDLEALVGDEEVFQVVRGNVTSASLLKLVENATRQMRLMALAGAANDTAANVDEPAEHIIMETSEKRLHDNQRRHGPHARTQSRESLRRSLSWFAIGRRTGANQRPGVPDND